MGALTPTLSPSQGEGVTVAREAARLLLVGPP
jgi:hypothetical protein